MRGLLRCTLCSGARELRAASANDDGSCGADTVTDPGAVTSSHSAAIASADPPTHPVADSAADTAAGSSWPDGEWGHTKHRGGRARGELPHQARAQLEQRTGGSADGGGSAGGH